MTAASKTSSPDGVPSAAEPRGAPATHHANRIHVIGAESERPEQTAGRHFGEDLAVAAADLHFDAVAAGERAGELQRVAAERLVLVLTVDGCKKGKPAGVVGARPDVHPFNGHRLPHPRASQGLRPSFRRAAAIRSGVGRVRSGSGARGRRQETQQQGRDGGDSTRNARPAECNKSSMLALRGCGGDAAIG